MHKIVRVYYFFVKFKRNSNYAKSFLLKNFFLSINSTNLTSNSTIFVFCLIDLQNNLSKIFCTSIIVKILIILFFNNYKESLSLNCFIKYIFYFSFLQCIIIIATIIRHYIEKFEYNKQIIYKFENNCVVDILFKIL